MLLSTIKCPERSSVTELEALIHATRTRPILEIKEFRRELKIAHAPGPIRWLLMWLGLNIARKRAHYFGTFQLSVYSGLGAESLNPLTPLTTLPNYRSICEDGSVNVRIHYDHRVMDGANVAWALERFEHILNNEVAGELTNLAQLRGNAPGRSVMTVHSNVRMAVVVVGASQGIGKEVAKIAYVERPAWQGISSCLSQ